MTFFKKHIIGLFFIICCLSIPSLEAQNTHYSLDTCKKMAMTNNVKIKNAALEIQQAKQTKKASFTKYFPSINATGAAFQSNHSFVDMDVNDVKLNLTFENQQLNSIWELLNTYMGGYFSNAATLNAQMIDNGIVAGVTALQPVFAGGRIVNGNRLAKLGISAAEYQSTLAENEICIETEKSYWLVVSLQEKMKTIEMVEQLLDTLHKDAAGAYQNGILLKNDLLKVKLKQNEMQSNRLKVENGITLSKMALCQYIGIDYSPSFQLSDTIGELVEPWSYITVDSDAVSRRTEYKLLNLSVDAERLKKKMLVGETLPQVAVGAGYLYNNLMEKDNTNALVFATLSIPISGWWEAAHNIKKQKLSEQIAANNRTDLIQKLDLQMQQAWNQVVETYLQAKNAQDAIEEASMNLKISNDYYHNGMSTLSDLLESQSLLQQTHDQYIDYCIQYQTALQTYLQMTKQ